MSQPVRRATTVVVLRNGEGGLEVLLLRRHRRNVFLPDAWVFPGGRVDAADADVDPGRVMGVEALAGVLACSQEEAFAHGVAGVRETMEEAGVWLGAGSPPLSARDELSTGVDFGAWMAAHDLHIDLARFGAWAWWVTPRGEPRRYDTRFLVIHWGGPPEHAVHDSLETVGSGWFHPATCALQTIEDFPLAPPTWWTLKELSDYPCADAVMTACGDRKAKPVQPILDVSSGGLEVWLPGHHAHEAAAMEGLPTCIRMRDGVWQAI